jgi:23S rRNA pseudouridine955/2504/2580 synthase
MAHAGWPLLGDGKYGREKFNKGFDEKGQALYSYKLEFSFPTDAGILEYLRGKEFKVKEVDFAEKYFSVTDLNF